MRPYSRTEASLQGSWIHAEERSVNPLRILLNVFLLGVLASAVIASESAAAPAAHVRAGDLLVLTGLASDLEDGPLSGSQLRWRSTIDGPLGDGDELAVDALSVGVHRLTLSVTDSGGLTGEAEVTVHVDVDALRTYLPIIQH
jgi:hypothetical protein